MGYDHYEHIHYEHYEQIKYIILKYHILVKIEICELWHCHTMLENIGYYNLDGC